MIKNLLFDLGGVIMDIKRTNAVEALKEIGMTNADEFLGEYSQKGPFLKLEEGEISASQFRDDIRREIGGNVSDEAIDRAFCRFLVGIPEHRLDSLRELRDRGYKVYMLSNTNPIMWHSRIAEEFKKQGHTMDYYFDGEVTSFECRSCKPAPEIFFTAVKRFGIEPAETLFLDDSPSNVAAAERLGFNAICVEPGKEFADMLASRL